MGTGGYLETGDKCLLDTQAPIYFNDLGFQKLQEKVTESLYFV